MEILNELRTLISGIISGMIIFQSVIVAPLIFKFFEQEKAGPFLRSIFPKLFISVFLLGLVSLIISFYLKNNLSSKIIPICTIVAMVICYLLIPFINEARDSGETILFNRLHTLTVLLTVFVLIVNLGQIFFK